jgi:hypothetical protein
LKYREATSFSKAASVLNNRRLLFRRKEKVIRRAKYQLLHDSYTSYYKKFSSEVILEVRENTTLPEMLWFSVARTQRSLNFKTK